MLTAVFVVALCAVYGLLSYEGHRDAQTAPECNPAELAAARRSGDAAAAAVARNPARFDGAPVRYHGHTCAGDSKSAAQVFLLLPTRSRLQPSNGSLPTAC